MACKHLIKLLSVRQRLIIRPKLRITFLCMELIFCLDHPKKNLSELHSIDLSQSIAFGFFRYQIIYFIDDFLSYSVALIFRVKSNLVEHFTQIIYINFREIVIVG